MTFESIFMLWLVYGVLAAGFGFAYFQGKYPVGRDDRAENLGFWLLVGLVFGPIALLVSFFGTGFGKYGWKLWTKERK